MDKLELDIVIKRQVNQALNRLFYARDVVRPYKVRIDKGKPRFLLNQLSAEQLKLYQKLLRNGIPQEEARKVALNHIVTSVTKNPVD